jgi:hypothetical protein
MSSVPNFKHIGDFPWCRSSAGAVSSPYVLLTETGGDGGLAEARRLWWDLEKVTFTPSGTLDVFGVGSNSFSEALTIERDEPKARVCNDSTIVFDGFYGDYKFDFNRARFRLAFVSGRWRLHYGFSFVIVVNPGNYSLSILEGDGTGSAKGTINFFGYDLDWVAFITSGAGSGIGLSVTTEFYTYT